jgi:protein-L-isoaspartate(D-aspartate) O-methyltransferase
VLRAITPHVSSLERIGSLARKAEQALCSTGITDITIRVGDGSLGWPEDAAFDAIIVTSGSPGIPEPLKTQLRDGGRLVIPAGTRLRQTLFRVVRIRKKFAITEHGDCVFVPLTGRCGWRE